MDGIQEDSGKIKVKFSNIFKRKNPLAEQRDLSEDR